MSFKPRFPLNHIAESESRETDASDRAAEVLAALIRYGTMIEKSKFKAAYLLEECKREGYWANHYPSYTAFVEDAIGISKRAAQEMIRVVKQCRNADVPLERVAELGWSKVALISKRLTKENAPELLAQVEQKTFGQLQEMLRQAKRKEKKPADQPAKGVVSGTLKPIVLSETVHQAIYMAQEHTGSLSGEENLNFVAEKFMELFRKKPLLQREPSLN